jgi:hypothetical protein
MTQYPMDKKTRIKKVKCPICNGSGKLGLIADTHEYFHFPEFFMISDSFTINPIPVELKGRYRKIQIPALDIFSGSWDSFFRRFFIDLPIPICAILTKEKGSDIGFLETWDGEVKLWYIMCHKGFSKIQTGTVVPELEIEKIPDKFILESRRFSSLDP